MFLPSARFRSWGLGGDCRRVQSFPLSERVPTFGDHAEPYGAAGLVISLAPPQPRCWACYGWGKRRCWPMGAALEAQATPATCPPRSSASQIRLVRHYGPFTWLCAAWGPGLVGNAGRMNRFTLARGLVPARAAGPGGHVGWGWPTGARPLAWAAPQKPSQNFRPGQLKGQSNFSGHGQTQASSSPGASQSRPVKGSRVGVKSRSVNVSQVRSSPRSVSSPGRVKSRSVLQVQVGSSQVRQVQAKSGSGKRLQAWTGPHPARPIPGERTKTEAGAVVGRQGDADDFRCSGAALHWRQGWPAAGRTRRPCPHVPDGPGRPWIGSDHAEHMVGK